MSRKATWALVLVPLELTFAIYFYFGFPLILALVEKAPTPEIISLIRPIIKVLPFVALASAAAWILAISDVVKFQRASKTEWIAGFFLFPPIVIAAYYATFVHKDASASLSAEGHEPRVEPK